jgi:uncharacterized membrane protein HdeD (DUF308 family)
MKAFVTFMASTTGRLVRIVAGIVLILVGLFALNGMSGATAGIVVAVIGLVPLLAGLFDVCLLAPLFGYPFSGAKIRTGK